MTLLMSPCPPIQLPPSVAVGTTGYGIRVYGKLTKAELHRLTRPGVEKATKFLHKKIRLRLNKPYPPSSRPGQPPRRRTGVGRLAVKWKVGRVGTPSGWIYLEKKGFYMEILDDKNYRHGQRPWLQSTWELNKLQLFKKMTGEK